MKKIMNFDNYMEQLLEFKNEPQICPYCDGSGTERDKDNNPKRDKHGKTITCKTCKGIGTLPKYKTKK